MTLMNLVGTAHAAGCTPGDGGIDLGDCLNLSNGQTVSSVYSNPAVLVNVIVKNLFVIAGIILFVLILYAGFKFIQSGSGGKEDAKKIITSAVAGFVVMLAAYWIVQIIQVVTGVNVGIPGI